MGKLTAEGMDRRFFTAWVQVSSNGQFAKKAGSEGYKYTMGISAGIDPEETIHTKLFIFGNQRGQHKHAPNYNRPKSTKTGCQNCRD